jgi:hypothetical protein
MAKYDPQLTDLKNQLASAKRVLIALPAQTTIDKVAAALTLMLTLKASGKETVTLTTDTLKVSHTNLFGIGEIKSTLPQSSSGNFIVTLEGVVDTTTNTVPALEKLDWYPEGKNLNLVFHTTQGQKFEPFNLTHKYEGGNSFDLIFVIGASSLNDLGEIYSQNNALFTGKIIINLDNSPTNTNFGTINILDQQARTISEMIFQVLQGLGLSLDADSATNLVSGIYDATQNLTVNPKPDTFMALGGLMQLGGKMPQAQSQPAHPQPVISSPSAAPVTAQSETPVPVTPVQPETTSQSPDLSQILQIPPNLEVKAPQPEIFPTPQVVSNQTSNNTQETPSGEVATTNSLETDIANPAPDWLTPKIFKGGSLG